MALCLPGTNPVVLYNFAAGHNPHCLRKHEALPPMICHPSMHAGQPLRRHGPNVPRSQQPQYEQCQANDPEVHERGRRIAFSLLRLLTAACGTKPTSKSVRRMSANRG